MVHNLLAYGRRASRRSERFLSPDLHPQLGLGQHSWLKEESGLQSRIGEAPVSDLRLRALFERLLSVTFRIVGYSKGFRRHRSPHEPGKRGDRQ